LFRSHIAHVSTRESVRAIREAKKRGVPVTAETAPHYFTLTEKAVERYWTHAKMSPPLRSEKDRLAILEGLADGTIDVIATDHAPHSVTEKDTDMKKAPNGIIGLETSLPLSLKLVESGILSFSDLVRKMSKNPASIIGVNSGIYVDGPADITIIDPELRHTVDAASFQSKSRNCPFDGWEMKGKAVMTIIGGRIAYNDRHFVP
ncbi:MAG: amidohydrolase family protein, partial [Desulfobacterales bacterium]|nr:amidohydrolase family protein [Desulfobacterales bacterium]